MLYHAMTESVAAEHAARMTAMDSATNNASDMIDDAHAAHESRAPGGHHQGDYRDRFRRSGGAVKSSF
jgi:hypothetical protein